MVDKTTSSVGSVTNFANSPVFYHAEIHSAPPDVTSYTNNTSSSTTSDGIHVERTAGAGTAAPKQSPKYGNAELMETGDGECGLHQMMPPFLRPQSFLGCKTNTDILNICLGRVNAPLL